MPESKEINKILVIKLRGIGDVVLSTIILESLKLKVSILSLNVFFLKR